LSEGVGIKPAPGSGESSLLGQSVIEQNRELLGFQRVERCVVCFRPPLNAPAGESLKTKPVARPVIDEQFEGGACAVAKDEQGAGERVLRERAFAQSEERIESFAEVDRLAGEQNPELGNELNHRHQERRKSEQRVESAVASNGGRTSVIRAPSVRSSTNRQFSATEVETGD